MVDLNDGFRPPIPRPTTDAPVAIGLYSQAIAVNGQLFVSGQLPIDPVTGAFISEDPVEQALG